MRRDDLRPRREPNQPVLRWQTATGRNGEHALSKIRPATIGRDPDCTIALDSRMVSKAHAMVEFRDSEFTIQDLESANGTRVNGEPTSIRVLEPGDRIEVGDVELTYLDLGADDDGPAGAAPSSGSKAVRLGLTAALTLMVMLGLMFALIGGPGGRGGGAAPAEAPLAPASAALLASLRQASADAQVVKDVVQYATVAGAAPVRALQDEGRLRLEAGRWREAALLLAAAASRDGSNASVTAAFEDAAAHLDRAASKALAAAELADYGMRYDDALLHADEVLQLIDRQDPRYDRASKIAEQARSGRSAK